MDGWMAGSVAKCKPKKKTQGITQFQFKRPSRKDETVVSKKRVNKFVRPVARDLVTTGSLARPKETGGFTKRPSGPSPIDQRRAQPPSSWIFSLPFLLLTYFDRNGHDVTIRSHPFGPLIFSASSRDPTTLCRPCIQTDNK